MIILDASIAIAYLNDADVHRAAALDVLVEPDAFGIHPVTLAEALVYPVRRGRVDRALQQLENIGVRELTRVDGEAVRLARLRVETGLKLPDCCVLSATEAHRARLATVDARLASAARSRGVEVVGLSD